MNTSSYHGGQVLYVCQNPIPTIAWSCESSSQFPAILCVATSYSSRYYMHNGLQGPSPLPHLCHMKVWLPPRPTCLEHPQAIFASALQTPEFCSFDSSLFSTAFKEVWLFLFIVFFQHISSSLQSGSELKPRPHSFSDRSQNDKWIFIFFPSSICSKQESICLQLGF